MNIVHIRNTLAVGMRRTLEQEGPAAGSEIVSTAEVAPELHRAVWGPLMGWRFALSATDDVIVVTQVFRRIGAFWQPIGWMEARANDPRNNWIAAGNGLWPDMLTWKEPS